MKNVNAPSPIQKRIRKWATGVFVSLALIIGGPIYGLLGTIVGMTQTFEDIRIHGTDTPEDFSAGISMALQTTNTGIIVALVALVPFGISLIFLLKARAELPPMTTEPEAEEKEEEEEDASLG